MPETKIILPVESQERRAERIQRIAAFLGKLPVDKPWQCMVGPFKKQRSDRQNNAMWGPAYKTLSDFTGHTEPELHDIICKLYFGEIEHTVLGVKSTKPRRTTTKNERGERDVLNTEKMAAFFAFIQMKAAEVGCYIEDPNPQLRTRAA